MFADLHLLRLEPPQTNACPLHRRNEFTPVTAKGRSRTGLSINRALPAENDYGEQDFVFFVFEKV